ncbi:peptidoglycan-binding protein [Propionibacteriaceae bacterium Y2011]|uniref:peptidoglycan-binding protein n=1 Tax=Microlunatus sp. Y2014 TaxID=3418488 RepID=UPI003B46C7BF
MFNRRSLLLGSAALGAGVLGAGVVAPASHASLPTSATSGFPVAKKGVPRSGNVKYIQARLGITIDGSFGPDTHNAVVSFQGSKGLEKDGIVGPQTWARLLDVVRRGSSGRVVKGLQVKLGGLSWDGEFGPATEAKVKDYQGRHGLTKDGIVGAQTWGKLMGASSGGGGGRGPNPKGTYTNGRMPSSALAHVGFGNWRMSTYCIDDFKRLNSAFRGRFGINLPISGSMSAYRTYDQQVYLWNEYQAGRGNLAARPGTSNHGWGLACDIAVAPYGSTKYNWLNANAPSYGFNDDVGGEPWHWAYQR